MSDSVRIAIHSLCKFWHFQMALSQWKLAWLTPNLGILWISVSSFRLCESIVANPITYRLVPRPSRFETRPWDRFPFTLKRLVVCEFFSCSTNISCGLSAYNPQKLVVYCLNNDETSSTTSKELAGNLPMLRSLLRKSLIDFHNLFLYQLPLK